MKLYRTFEELCDLLTFNGQKNIIKHHHVF